jgi:hypothetical protein
MQSFDKRLAAVFVGGLVMAAVLLAPPAIQGDDWNLATRFTISQQFEVPGAVLEANKPYVIRLYDSPSERNVIQILNEDQTQLITMFMAIRSERMQPTDDTKFAFMETAPGFPLPIKEWFYPGRLTGREFIYTPEQLAQIATYKSRAATTQVAAATPVVEEPLPAAVAEPVAEPAGEPVEPVAIAQAEPPAAEAELPAVEAAPQPEPAVTEIAQAELPRTELPRTAGELPLIGLIGLLCLGAGFGLRAVRTHN